MFYVLIYKTVYSLPLVYGYFEENFCFTNGEHLDTFLT